MEQLLERARQGDRAALDEVFARCAGRLLALIRLRLGRDLRRRLESRDILQATLMKGFEHLDDLRGDDSGSLPLMGWLARIAENEIRDQAAFHRRQRRDAGRELDLDDSRGGVGPLVAQVRSATSRLVWDERARRLEAAIEELPEAQREVILLRRFEELGYPEIGRRLGKSPAACRMLFARAMAALTHVLDQLT